MNINKNAFLISLTCALTACVSQPETKTVYLPQRLDAVSAVQVSDIVQYRETEIPVIAINSQLTQGVKVVGEVFGDEQSDAILHVYFDTASSTLTPYGLTEISGKLPDAFKSVVIKGYADPRGSNRYNLKLSQDRANAVAQYLEGKGIRVSKIEYFGEDEMPERTVD